jgi:hypothetical protein
MNADFSKRIPGPWFASDRFVSTRPNGFGDVAVIQPDHGDAEATAAFIAHAMNSYGELVEALDTALFCMIANEKIKRPEWDESATPESAIGRARAALSKAKGETP